MFFISEKFLGMHIFEVLLKTTASKNTIYNEEERLLYVKKGVRFAVTFSFGNSPPPGAVVSAVICCEKPEDIDKFGPVIKCKKHGVDGSGK